MENHKVTIDNRKIMTVTDIKEIDSFDEGEIRASLNEGGIVIKGRELNVRVLDLEEGRLVVEGHMDSFMYVKVKEKGGKSVFARILK